MLVYDNHHQKSFAKRLADVAQNVNVKCIQMFDDVSFCAILVHYCNVFINKTH